MKNTEFKKTEIKRLGIECFKVLIFLFSVFCFSSFSALAAFEDTGAGARPIGLGNAFTALADDVHTIYYNPAGLGKITRTEITAGYGRLYLGLDDGSNIGSGFVGCAQPLKFKKHDLGTVGLGWLNLSLAGYYAENTFIFSYGRNVWRSVYFGANVKLLQKRVGQDMYTAIDPVFNYGKRSSKLGYSVDIGALYQATQRLSFAVTATDIIQPDMIFYKTNAAPSSKVPYGFKLGTAYQMNTLNIAVDLSCKKSVTQRGRDIKFYAGAEKWFLGYTFAVRGGFGLGSRDYKNAAVGASYSLSIFRLDYAFIYPLSGITDTAGSHRMSLTMLTGPSKKEMEKIATRKDLERRLKDTEESLRKTQKEVGDTKIKVEKAESELERTKQETRQAQDKIKELEANQNMEEAKKTYQLAVEKEKQDKYNFWSLTGKRHIEYGEWAQALGAYQNALTYKPDDPKAKNEITYIQIQDRYSSYFSSGKMYVASGAWEQALGAFRSALEYRPGDSKSANEIAYIQKQNPYSYWSWTGKKHIEYGEWGKALEAYRNALTYKPGDPVATNEIAYIQKEIEKRTKPAESSAPPAQPEKGKAKIYTVKEGDALPAIAQEVYGDSSRWKEIYEANKDKIIEGKPQPGQVLIIP